MRDHDEGRRPDGTVKPLAEQARRVQGADGARASESDAAAGLARTGGDQFGSSSAALAAEAGVAYAGTAAATSPPSSSAYRHAAYLAPAPDTPWWKAGSAWLGRDAATGQELKQPLIPGLSMSMQQRVTASPRRYGWHATLRAPFMLASDADAVMLRGRLTALCRERRPFDLPLKVALLGDFLALVPGGDTRDIDALARSCVSHLHALAAPLSEADLERRRAAGLTPEEDRLLVRWGYPYVMDRFRLHFSLTGALRDVAPDTVDAIRQAAEDWFAALPPLRVDAVSLFVEPVAGADFLHAERMGLGE